MNLCDISKNQNNNYGSTVFWMTWMIPQNSLKHWRCFWRLTRGFDNLLDHTFENSFGENFMGHHFMSYLFMICFENIFWADQISFGLKYFLSCFNSGSVCKVASLQTVAGCAIKILFRHQTIIWLTSCAIKLPPPR